MPTDRHKAERGRNPSPPDIFLRCAICGRFIVRVEPARAEPYWRHHTPKGADHAD